jgi:hypothetical protein
MRDADESRRDGGAFIQNRKKKRMLTIDVEL